QKADDARQGVSKTAWAEEVEGAKAQEHRRQGATEVVPRLELKDRPVVVAACEGGGGAQAVAYQPERPHELVWTWEAEVLVEDEDGSDDGGDSGEQLEKSGGGQHGRDSFPLGGLGGEIGDQRAEQTGNRVLGGDHVRLQAVLAQCPGSNRPDGRQRNPPKPLLPPLAQPPPA